MDKPSQNNADAREILRSTGVEVHKDEFTVVSISNEDWPRLLQDSSLSPSGKFPYMIFSDQYEVTLVLSEADFEMIRVAAAGSRLARGYRMLTFTVPVDLSVVGFMAEISRILSEGDIPILALSAFSRDHLLIRQNDLAAALKLLGPFVKDLC